MERSGERTFQKTLEREGAWSGMERGAGGRGLRGAVSELNPPLRVHSHLTSKIIDLC